MQQMADIYRMANHVLIWVGNASRDSKIAMDVIRDIGLKVRANYSTGRAELVSDDARDAWLSEPIARIKWSQSEQAARITFCDRNWFWRLWIQQEVALAQHGATIFCNHEGLPWEVFETLSFASIKNLGLGKTAISLRTSITFALVLEHILWIRSS